MSTQPAPVQQGQLTHGKLIFKSGKLTVCDECGIEFMQTTPSQLRCSDSCQRIARIKQMKKCHAAAKRRKNA